jgi:hypothetical protein
MCLRAKPISHLVSRGVIHSLTHAQRQPWSQCAHACCHLTLGIFADIDLAARTGDGDKLFTRQTDEFTLGGTRWRSERMQVRRPS